MRDPFSVMNVHPVWVVTIGLIGLALVVFGWSRVFEKAGYSPLLCLLMIIPGINLLTFLWLAFSKWPIHKRLSS